MVFGQTIWSQYVKSDTPRKGNRCCTISWSSQRNKKKKRGTSGRTAGNNEPKENEKIVHFELRITEADGDEEGRVVFTEKSNFSSPYSLKLKTHTTYNLQLLMDPELTLQYLKMEDHRFHLSPQQQQQQQQFAVDGRKAYGFIWSTNSVPKTTNKKRFILSTVLKIECYKKFKFDMLVKFYKDGERDVLDGVDLSSVSLEFIVPVTTSHSALLNDEDGDGGGGSGGDRGFHHINDIVFNAVEEDDD